MNTLLSRTNSWHWLLMAMAGCLLIAGYFSQVVWKETTEEQGPKLLSMQARVNELKLLEEEDAFLLEEQAAALQKRINAYEATVREKVGQPIPTGEQSVLTLSNEINRALLKHQLRIVEQEQMEVPTVKKVAPAPAIPPAGVQLEGVPAEAAAALATKETTPEIPFTTREIRYVLEGEYKHMFMFLVRQSHLKPSYHFKDIKIMPVPRQAGMRMEFTVQIHFI